MKDEPINLLMEACFDGLFGTGEPILHEAVRSGNEEVVKSLVSYGADIHAKN